MEVLVKDSIIIQPAQETPKHCLQISDLDLLVPAYLVPTVYFYRRTNDNSSNFFDVGLLKVSLSKVLLPFYPIAGRWGKDKNGRIKVKCNGEGVLFVEAETNCVIDDLGDMSSSLKLLQLVPAVDHSKDLFSYPLLMTQVTHFKCGGVCLGVRLHHTLVDATSKYYFINSWAEMTRGLPISIPPFYDRSLLSDGVPSFPTFHHIEYDPTPSMNNPSQNPGTISTAVLKFSRGQIHTLKRKLEKDHGSIVKYSSYEILVAIIWRCACKARGLSNNQASKIFMPANGRSKLNPPIPSGFVGNVVFYSASVALTGDILSEPLNDTIERIHKALKQMNDMYMKSSLSFLRQQPDLSVLQRGHNTYRCPNLIISKLSEMPLYDANFGWGRPVFLRTVNTLFDGMTHILPGPIDDGSWILLVTLETNHLQLFKKFFGESVLHHQHHQDVRSRY